MENIYYVYVILNLEESGNYKYGDVEFDHLPIYIGKGKNKRQFSHFLSYSMKVDSDKNKSLLKYKCVSQILESNLSESESFNRERYYIELIGRKDMEKGPLLNLTSGGQGASGYKYTPDQILTRSKEQSTVNNNFYGRKHDKSTFNKFKRPVYQVDIITDKIISKFDSLSDAAKKTSSNETHIRDCCNGSRKTHNGFKWKDVEDYVKKRRSKNNNTQKRKILQLDLDGKIIDEHESISSASKMTGIIKSNIVRCLSSNKPSAGGFKWSYKNESKIIIMENKILKYKQFNEGKKDKFPNIKKDNIDGFVVYIGKDAKSNDHLTFNISNDEDIWMHVKGKPGSHVVIRIRENLPTQEVLKKVAELAKKNSKMDKADKATVVYCQRRFVKKERGMNDGQVKVDYINAHEIIV